MWYYFYVGLGPNNPTVRRRKRATRSARFERCPSPHATDAPHRTTMDGIRALWRAKRNYSYKHAKHPGQRKRAQANTHTRRITTEHCVSWPKPTRPNIAFVFETPSLKVIDRIRRESASLGSAPRRLRVQDEGSGVLELVSVRSKVRARGCAGLPQGLGLALVGAKLLSKPTQFLIPFRFPSFLFHPHDFPFFSAHTIFTKTTVSSFFTHTTFRINFHPRELHPHHFLSKGFPPSREILLCSCGNDYYADRSASRSNADGCVGLLQGHGYSPDLRLWLRSGLA